MSQRDNVINLLFSHPAWMTDAPCKGLTHLFFADAHETGNPSSQAKQICATCPHRLPCLEYAIDNHEEHGIWAGRNRTEIQAVRRRRRDMGWTTGANKRKGRHGTTAGANEHRRNNEPLCAACQWATRKAPDPFPKPGTNRETA